MRIVYHIRGGLSSGKGKKEFYFPGGCVTMEYIVDRYLEEAEAGYGGNAGINICCKSDDKTVQYKQGSMYAVK